MIGPVALFMSVVSGVSFVSEVGTTYEGKCSWFQVEPGAALAIQGGHQPLPTTRYCACRWNYRDLKASMGLRKPGSDVVKNELRMNYVVRVVNPANGRVEYLKPIDAGPYARGRSIDIDRGSMETLGAKTDDKLQFTLLKREHTRGRRQND
jgi:hypothetical protein